jgi:hypothetical protein
MILENRSLKRQKRGVKGMIPGESFPGRAKKMGQGNNTWRIVPLNGENVV